MPALKQAAACHIVRRKIRQSGDMARRYVKQGLRAAKNQIPAVAVYRRSMDVK
jgi:hypothetical protein